MIMEITQQEFIKAEGRLCPNCGSDEMDSTDGERYYCMGGCGCIWEKQTEVVGYEILRFEKEEE